MTAKEKANELCYKYFELVEFISKEEAVRCAIIAVEEIMLYRPTLPNEYSDTIGYWQEVKQHLEEML